MLHLPFSEANADHERFVERDETFTELPQGSTSARSSPTEEAGAANLLTLVLNMSERTAVALCLLIAVAFILAVRSL